MTKAAIKVPVNLRGHGGILHDTDYARGAESREEAERINAEQRSKHGHDRWGAEYVMEVFEPRTMALRLVEAYHHKSAAYVWFENREGERYPMFLTDLTDILGHGNMTDGWLEPATYEVTKRGARSYGIRRQRS